MKDLQISDFGLCKPDQHLAQPEIHKIFQSKSSFLPPCFAGVLTRLPASVLEGSGVLAGRMHGWRGNGSDVAEDDF